MAKQQLIGPFHQLLPLAGLPLKGPVPDKILPIIEMGGILIEEERIVEVGNYEKLRKMLNGTVNVIHLEGKHSCVPGIIDAHTHICFAGNRARDYAMRNSGSSYLEIASAGGGIWETVTQTRKASREELIKGIVRRANRHIKNGTTTIEVKSGYGLDMETELKMLEAITVADSKVLQDLIPTCLAAHIPARDFEGDAVAYLNHIGNELLPEVWEKRLASRVDIFIEEGAFSGDQVSAYLKKAKEIGFDLTVHADQFTTGGSEVAVRYSARSADHLEASTDKEIELLAASDVCPVALPGASLGLGCGFTPARKLLDAGCSLAIASDHNPGSAPMGDLLTQAAILGAYEKLSNAEVLCSITFRAAAALNMDDRGMLAPGKLADFVVFHTGDYRDILYNQGNLKPCMVWKKGELAYDKHK